MTWSKKALGELRKRIVEAQSYEDGDDSLCATCAVLFLGWIYTNRRYGSGFIDQDGNPKTWRDLPSLEKCHNLINVAQAVDAVLVGTTWNAAIDKATLSVRNLQTNIDDDFAEGYNCGCVDAEIAIRFLKKD